MLVFNCIAADINGHCCRHQCMYYQVALKPDNKLRTKALFCIVHSFEGALSQHSSRC